MFSGDRRLPLKDFLYINLKGIGKFGQREKAAFGNTFTGADCQRHLPAYSRLPSTTMAIPFRWKNCPTYMQMQRVHRRVYATGCRRYGDTLPGIEECCCIFKYPAHVMAEADEFLRNERAGRVPLREGHLGSKKV